MTLTVPRSTYEAIQMGAQRNLDAPALSYFRDVNEHEQPRIWSYRQLLKRITQTANAFTSLGASRDTVIAYILPNLPETHFTVWGGQAAGIVAALNPMLEAAALRDILRASNAQILVTLAPVRAADVRPPICDVIDGLESIKHLILVTPDRLIERERHQKLISRATTPSSAAAFSVPVHHFAELIDAQAPDRLISGRAFSRDDVSSYFCTGGTTGRPKIAVRTHGNEVANARSVADVFGTNVGPGRTLFCGLPMFHVNAVSVTGLMPFSVGAHVVLGTPQGYRGDGVLARFWEIVERHRINIFSGVPTIYASLLREPTGGRDLSSLKLGICGAAPMPVAVFKDFEAATGIKIIEGYGLTEATCVSTLNPPTGERRIGSIGVSVPGQLMKAVIVDENLNWLRDCEPQEVGLLVVAGPNVFVGYATTDQNRSTWVNLQDGRRWLNTGDLGKRDSDGYFWLTGRKKDLIIRAGHNIDPLMIEEPLHRHPAVGLAAAIGRPDARVGELPVAYVELKLGSNATEQDLMDFVAREVPEKAARPKSIRIIERMPLTAVGKIFKPDLKRREIKSALLDALQIAGLTVERLEVTETPAFGTLIDVSLGTGGAEGAVREVLGKFPFAVTLHHG